MTRQPHIFFIVLSAAFVPITADACARMQPVAAFVVLNDQDGDRALNLTEWLAASTGDNLIASFKLNDPEEFALYDIDHNGVVEARELGFNSVHYRTDPCLRIQSSNFMNLNANSVALH